MSSGEFNVENPGSFNDFAATRGLEGDRAEALTRYTEALGEFKGSIIGERWHPTPEGDATQPPVTSEIHQGGDVPVSA